VLATTVFSTVIFSNLPSKQAVLQSGTDQQIMCLTVYMLFIVMNRRGMETVFELWKMKQQLSNQLFLSLISY